MIGAGVAIGADSRIAPGAFIYGGVRLGSQYGSHPRSGRNALSRIAACVAASVGVSQCRLLQCPTAIEYVAKQADGHDSAGSTSAGATSP